MNTYRYRPKGNFIHEAHWNELLDLAKNLKNDLSYLNTDLRFLQELIEEFYLKLLFFEPTAEYKDLENDIKISVVQCAILSKRIPIFLKHFRDRILKSDCYDSPNLRTEFELFEDDCSHQMETVKIIRFMTFKMLKNGLENEKTKPFWKFN